MEYIEQTSDSAIQNVGISPGGYINKINGGLDLLSFGYES